MTVKYAVFNELQRNVAGRQPIRVGTAMSTESANLQGSTPGTYVEIVDLDPVTEVVTGPSTIPLVVSKQTMRVGTLQTAATKTTLVANGTDSLTISPIPAGATCEVFLPENRGLLQPNDFVVNDGSLVITTTVSGIYSIRLAYQNFLDFKVTFNAT